MPSDVKYLAPQIEQFIHDNPQGVLTSFRRNGMPQLSIVTVYPRDGGVGISITENRMKFKNLLRDPRCSVLVSHADWWSGFLVFEGTAELFHSGNTDAEALRAGAPPHLQRHDQAAQRGLGSVRSDHRGRQAGRDDRPPAARVRVGAGPHARGGGEVARSVAAGGPRAPRRGPARALFQELVVEPGERPEHRPARPPRTRSRASRRACAARARPGAGWWPPWRA